ncbi:uncharacterized protein LOC126894461 isoform X2 [Daktulosphaira vitifoliae]|uniref:uncharacterized protein LOC126894461 isoform X2 n=1 Tax=Daktulosphaira vitifoliae TaxID=58002 RepID=UPI0021AAB05E|nr:uncharacterized protein LOC126894461 isoform X2 [Daktulosphaira vitifoliae]
MGLIIQKIIFTHSLLLYVILFFKIIPYNSLAQTTCNQGVGRIVYERLPDYQLQGFDDEVVRDTSPPFRVLEKCEELCLRDRTVNNNLVRTCTSFDFQPGSRIASFSGTVEYEESTCYLTREQAHPEGIGVLVAVPNSVHYTEVCLSSSRIERECANRHYVFERHTRKKLKLPTPDYKEIIVNNRTDCEDKCLNEYTFVCRSVTYDSASKTCWISRFTRRTHPEMLEDDPSSEYLENTCLSMDRRCDGSIIFIKEENKRLGGPFEVDIFANLSLIECQAQCLRAEKYFCRAVEYDDQIRRCIIFEEDSLSQKDDLRVSSSPTHDLYDLVCLDNPKGNEFSDNTLTSHLFSDGRKPDTAFQRYRNSRLGGEFHSEITGRSLSECLDECLRQVSFQCRSAVYSDRFRICRLSRFNQRDGHRVIYDADYDYYENLMNGVTSPPYVKPDILGQGSNFLSSKPPYLTPDKPIGSGLGSIYGGGSYPAYTGAVGIGSLSGVIGPQPNPINSPEGYWGHVGGHGANIPPFLGQNTGGSYGIGSTQGVIGSSIAPYGASSIQSGFSHLGVAPIGGYNLGPPSIGPPLGIPGYYGGNGLDGNRPYNIKCDDIDGFKQMGVRMRLARGLIKRYITAPTLSHCERECSMARDIDCRSFNYRTAPYGAQRENCELSDQESRLIDMNNPSLFENAPDYDFYERSVIGSRISQECLDVTQECNEDGMTFTLRTPEGFLGRIYTHGYYDRCFYRGNGGTANILRISGAQGYPDCGTQRYGDTLTNIVVVQFSDYVQTSRDKRYNLTCLFRSPGETIVTSNYMTANSGSPIPIEYLPAENSLSSRVRLSILFQGRPTQTIAVGDPLTFRIEAHDGHAYASDIFATNVIARDPYSGRSVQLIDRYGCPIDNYVFPGLDKSREGDGLEARFNAFKIPESNFLVFEATIRTCRDGCQPAYCTLQTGRMEPSLGRRRRDVNEQNQNDTAFEEDSTIQKSKEEEKVRQVIEVFESRYDIPLEQTMTSESAPEIVCLTIREYYSMVFSLFMFLTLLITASLCTAIYYKRYWLLITKNELANCSSGLSNATIERSNNGSTIRSLTGRSFFSDISFNRLKPFMNIRVPVETSESGPKNISTVVIEEATSKMFGDPNGPIYTDPSLFERSRSLQSAAYSIDSVLKNEAFYH